MNSEFRLRISLIFSLGTPVFYITVIAIDIYKYWKIWTFFIIISSHQILIEKNVRSHWGSSEIVFLFYLTFISMRSNERSQWDLRWDFIEIPTWGMYTILIPIFIYICLMGVYVRAHLLHLHVGYIYSRC